MENVPDNSELQTTSYNVVPTESAVVYREFGAEHVLRYILQVKERDGRVLNGEVHRQSRDWMQDL